MEGPGGAAEALYQEIQRLRVQYGDPERNAAELEALRQVEIMARRAIEHGIELQVEEWQERDDTLRLALSEVERVRKEAKL